MDIYIIEPGGKVAVNDGRKPKTGNIDIQRYINEGNKILDSERPCPSLTIE